MAHTRKLIKAIAAELDYRDASSFDRAFQRWTGMAPRAYRNRVPTRRALLRGRRFETAKRRNRLA